MAFMLLLLLAACTRSVSPVPEVESPVDSAALSKADWETEWDKWVTEANKEARLVLLVTGEFAPHKAVKEGFEKKYGIPVEIISGAPGLVEGKLLGERRAGLHTTDLFFGGGTSTISLKAQGAFNPIEKIPILPEAINPKAWWRGKLDYLDKDRYILAFLASASIPLAINTDLVSLTNEPKSWKDLLRPAWKGRIGMGDPRISGTANTNFTFVAYQRPELGLDFWREFVKQDPIILKDQRIQVEWLARGKYSILISPPPSLKIFLDVGAPVKYVRPEGPGTISSASGNVALLNKAPHPSAARIYINYLLTREAQTLYSVGGGFQSGRVDVPTDHLEPERVRQPGIDYIFTSYEDFALKTIEARKVAMEIFGQ